MASLEGFLFCEGDEGAHWLLQSFLFVFDNGVEQVILIWHQVELARADESTSLLECSDELSILVAKGDSSDFYWDVIAKYLIKLVNFRFQSINDLFVHRLRVLAAIHTFKVIIVLFLTDFHFYREVCRCRCVNVPFLVKEFLKFF